MLYESLRNEPEDQVIRIADIERELHLIRKSSGVSGESQISNTSMAKWKRLAGILGPCVTGADGKMTQEVDRRRWLTPREAAGITVQALWEPVIKKRCKADEQMLAIVPGLKAKNITARNLHLVYDRWLSSTGGEEALPIIRLLHTQISFDNARLKISQELQLKKPISVSTARNWVQELGGTYLANAPCPPEMIYKLISLAKERRSSLGRKSA